MKLVVVNIPTPKCLEIECLECEEKEVEVERGTAETEEGTSENDTTEDPPLYRWYLPFQCKARSYCYLDGVKIPTRCGSRGCLECNQLSLRKWVETAMHIRRRRTEKLYGIVLTNEKRVSTRKDVKDFLKGVRALFRKWERSSVGLGAAYWTSECVVKWEEEPSKIPCPVLQCEPSTEDYKRMSGEALEAIMATREACVNGDSCPYCRGRGFLPSVHIHVHATVMCEPFAYSEEAQKYNFDQTFNGRMFDGLVKECGLGIGKVQLLRKRRGMAEYMAKSMLQYIAKSTETRNEKKEVDWNRSAIDNLIASAVIGSRTRARGTNGRAYGLKLSKKDTSLDFSFGGDLGGRNAPNEYLDGEGEGCTLAALRNEYREVREDRQEREPRNGGVPLLVMAMGSRLVSSGAAGTVASDVLHETQLDTPNQKESNSYTTVRLYSSDGTFKGMAPQLGEQQILSKRWNAAAVVSSNQWFATQPLQGGWMIGRGGTAVHTSLATVNDLPRLIRSLQDVDYKHWFDIVNGFAPIDCSELKLSPLPNI
jgi:hypothetical protein